MHSLLHDEIDSFCKQVEGFIWCHCYLIFILVLYCDFLPLAFSSSLYIFKYISQDKIIMVLLTTNPLHHMMDSKVAGENMARKPYINWAVKRVARSLQVLWPRSRTNIYGSNATGTSLPTSDVDLVVCLPPVRNLVIFSSSYSFLFLM